MPRVDQNAFCVEFYNFFNLLGEQMLGTTPIPGELFRWDFFEMYYKMTGSSAKSLTNETQVL